MIVDLFNKDFNQVLNKAFVITVLFILESVANFIKGYIFSYLSSNIIYDLKKDIFSKILDLPPRAFDEMRVGDFMSRLHRDSETIAHVITNQFLNIIIDVLKLIVIAITSFSISVPLSFIVLFMFPAFCFIFIKFGSILRKQNEKLSRINDNYFSNVQQTLVGIREILSLGIKNNRFMSFLGISSELKKSEIKIALLNNTSSTLSNAVRFIVNILVILFGGYYIYGGRLAIDSFIAFNSYSNQFLFSMINIANMNSTLQQIMTSLERTFGLIDNLNYPQQKFGNRTTEGIKGTIEFRDVDFEYSEGNPVLKKISFTMPDNKISAIVGISGSGKTTIFNLIQKFYLPKSGCILFGGVPMDEFSEESLKSFISVVRQDPFIFHMTIKENLKLVNDQISDQEIVDACKKAYIHEFIESLPDKYDTMIGENGINLSGGQKQRLAIARALLKKTKVILLDEATSSLDNESQNYIKEVIQEISKNHTIIIIAHRLSTVVAADEILVVQDGKISQKGTHKELITSNDTYRRLYMSEYKIEKRVV